jgi:hypothetical protein
MHKRVSTANNESYVGDQRKTKGEIEEELRSFTKKMVGNRQH